MLSVRDAQGDQIRMCSSLEPPSFPIVVRATFSRIFVSIGRSCCCSLITEDVRPVRFCTTALSSGVVRRSLTICLYSGISGPCFLVAVCLPTAVRCLMVCSLLRWRCLILCKVPIGLTRQCSAARVAMAWHNSVGYSHSSPVAKRQPCSHLTPHGRCLCVGDSPQHHTSNEAMAEMLVTIAVFLSRCDPHMQALKPRNVTDSFSINLIISGICHMIDL